MKKTEAFEALGYTLANTRWSWSAEKDDGAVITLWRTELSQRDGRIQMDSRVDADDISEFRNKPGHKERTRILSKFNVPFFVDCILRDDISKSRQDAPCYPWSETETGMQWCITFFDGETGHFCAELMLAPELKI